MCGLGSDANCYNQERAMGQQNLSVESLYEKVFGALNSAIFNEKDEKVLAQRLTTIQAEKEKLAPKAWDDLITRYKVISKPLCRKDANRRVEVLFLLLTYEKHEKANLGATFRTLYPKPATIDKLLNTLSKMVKAVDDDLVKKKKGTKAQYKDALKILSAAHQATLVLQTPHEDNEVAITTIKQCFKGIDLGQKQYAPAILAVLFAAKVLVAGLVVTSILAALAVAGTIPVVVPISVGIAAALIVPVVAVMTYAITSIVENRGGFNMQEHARHAREVRHIAKSLARSRKPDSLLNPVSMWQPENECDNSNFSTSEQQPLVQSKIQ